MAWQEIAEIGLYLIGSERARNDRGHARVAEGELQCCRLQRHAVTLAHSLNASDLVQHLGRRVGVVVLGPGHGPGRGDAGGEHATDDDADVAPLAIGQLAVEQVVLHQGVAEGHEKEVDVEQVEEARHHAELVDAGPDRLIWPPLRSSSSARQPPPINWPR